MTMRTTTLNHIVQSELFKRGFSEFEGDTPNTDFFDLGKFNFYDNDYQFIQKILRFDDDVQVITNWLFNGFSLQEKEYDLHFKKTFMFRFMNRQINRQTIEAFQMELATTFLSHEDFINRLYMDIDLFLTQTDKNKQDNLSQSEQANKQKEKQTTDGNTLTDNRQAFADLPQSSINLDVDNTVMAHASDNTISKNKQANKQTNDSLSEGETTNQTTGVTTGESKSFKLDELLKTNGLLDKVLEQFDRKCFLQIF